MTLGIHVRDAGEADQNYCRKTWLKALASPWSTMQADLGPRDYWTGMHRRVCRLLSTATVRVAVSDGDDHTIAGFACFDRHRRALHFVFVREELRRYGVAKMLVGEMDDGRSIVWYTHRTNLVSKLTLPERWQYSYYRGDA